MVDMSISPADIPGVTIISVLVDIVVLAREQVLVENANEVLEAVAGFPSASTGAPYMQSYMF
jgi:hypothetical protein